jgi:hypothetical protein
MNVTGYNTKYYFEFISQNGTGYTISIKQKNFAGSAVKRNLGRAPILRKEKSGAICGTSLEIYAECKVDGEFLELYTSDPKEFLVTVDVEGGTGYDDRLWIGYISPELYSEPDIAPPYDVQITATDGLGELKLYDYTPQGKKSLFALIQLLVGSSGLPTNASDFLLVSSLVNKDEVLSPVETLTNAMVDLDHLEGKSHYDVLTKILESLHATIHQHNGSWMIVRECDLAQNTTIHRMDGTSVSISALDYGQVYAKDWWVINQLDLAIEPARKKIIVSQPYSLKGDWLLNPECSSDTGWIKSGSTSYNEEAGTYALDGSAEGIYTNSISQSFNVEKSSTRHILTIKVRASSWYDKGAQVGIHVAINDGTDTYYLGRFQRGCRFRPELDYISEKVGDGEEAEFTYEFSIPCAGSMTVMISAFKAFLWSGFIYVEGCSLRHGELPEGFQHVLSLNNGARGEGDDIELAFGGITKRDPRDPGVGNLDRVIYGILTIDGFTTTKWGTDKVGQGDYLSVLAQDYALSVALPRLRIKGVLNTPLNAVAPFTFVTRDGAVLYAEVWERDLLNDEIAVELLSIPAATLSIESQTKSEIEGAGTQGGGGSSASQAASLTAHAGDESLHLTEEKNDLLSHWSIVNVGTEEEPQYILKANLPVASEGDMISFFADGYIPEPGFTRLDTWENYDNTTMAGYVLSAGLAYGMKTAIDDHETRITAIEQGGGGGGTPITIDSALSDTSENPVQNKIITAALNGKAAASHTHAGGDITSMVTNANYARNLGTTYACYSYNTLSSILSAKAEKTHQHLASDIYDGTIAIARLPVGTTSDKVAAGNHTHSDYLTTDAAANLYLTKTVAAQTYLGKNDTAANSLKLGGVLAANYLTESEASQTYQTQSGMSNYLTTTAAAGLYATQDHDHNTAYAAINGDSTKDFAAKALTATGLTLTDSDGNQLVIKYNNTYMATILVNTAGLNITLAGGATCKVVGNVVATGGITCNAT